MTVSTDLAEMLRTEMEYLYEDRARTDAKIAAIALLLDVAETPAATFTADDARDHEVAGRGGVHDPQHTPDTGPHRPRRASKVAKAKSTRLSLRAGLGDHEIETIRSMAADATYVEIAERFGVSRSTVSNIVNRLGCYE